MRTIMNYIGTIWVLFIAFGVIALAFELSAKHDQVKDGIEQGLEIDLLNR